MPPAAPAEQTGAVTPFTVVTVAAPFLRTLSKILPYFGTSVQNPALTVSAVSLTGATTTITIPATGVLSNPIVAGYVRLKVMGAGTVTAVAVTCTDGTNTETIASEPLAGTGVVLSATSLATIIRSFESEINPTSFSVVITGGTGGTASVEVAGSMGY